MNKLRNVKQLVMLTVLMFTVFCFTLPSLAQSTDSLGDYLERYAEIPTSRTEDGGFVLGDPEAPVTIVEFADFMCPHCQDYRAIVDEFVDQYVRTGQAKFEYRLFPVVNPQFSEFTAQLAECAAEQDGVLFWPAHDVLYDLATDQSIDLGQTPGTLAEALDLDLDALNTCTETADQFEVDSDLGSAFGVSGTPSILVRLDDETLAWPYFDGRVGSGGLQFEALEILVTAEDISEYVIVPEALLGSLVSGQPCDAPCWNDITPGKTTYEEAKAIVEANRQFIDIEEQTAPEQASILLTWATYDGYPCCQMYSEAGEFVDEIFLINTSMLVLGDVVAANGDPAYALARQTEDGDIVINLFYPDLNLLLYVFAEGIEEAELTADSDVVGASYVSSERIESLLTELQPTAWNGLEALDSYFAN